MGEALSNAIIFGRTAIYVDSISGIVYPISPQDCRDHYNGNGDLNKLIFTDSEGISQEFIYDENNPTIFSIVLGKHLPLKAQSYFNVVEDIQNLYNHVLNSGARIYDEVGYRMYTYTHSLTEKQKSSLKERKLTVLENTPKGSINVVGDTGLDEITEQWLRILDNTLAMETGLINWNGTENFSGDSGRAIQYRLLGQDYALASIYARWRETTTAVIKAVTRSLGMNPDDVSVQYSVNIPDDIKEAVNIYRAAGVSQTTTFQRLNLDPDSEFENIIRERGLFANNTNNTEEQQNVNG